jgi:hypothetical protein
LCAFFLPLLAEEANTFFVQLSSTFALLHRLRCLGITRFELSPGDLQVFKSSSPQDPRLLLLDFGQATTVDEFKKERAKYESYLPPEERSPWQTEDEERVLSLYNRFFKDVLNEWMVEETKAHRAGTFLGYHEAREP